MNRPTPRALAGLMGLFGTLVPSLALAAGDGGHWSLLSALPFRENLAHMMGRSWVEGVEVHSVDHILFGVIVSVIAITLTITPKRMWSTLWTSTPSTQLRPIMWARFSRKGSALSSDQWPPSPAASASEGTSVPNRPIRPARARGVGRFMRRGSLLGSPAKRRRAARGRPRPRGRRRRRWAGR